MHRFFLSARHADELMNLCNASSGIIVTVMSVLILVPLMCHITTLLKNGHVITAMCYFATRCTQRWLQPSPSAPFSPTLC